MEMKRTIIILVALAVVIYGLPAMPEESGRSSELPEIVFVPGVGPVPLDEFREVQLRQAGFLQTLGTALAPIIVSLVTTLLTNIATGITRGITSTLTTGFGMVRNTTKAQSFDDESAGLYKNQFPSFPPADIHPETYVVPSYDLNSPLVVSAGHVRPFLQFQTQEHGAADIVKPISNAKDGDGVKSSSASN